MNQPVKTGKYVSGDFFYNVRRNAEKRGIEFDISLEYLDELIKEQNFRCVYTGAKIDAKTRKQYTASLDRRSSDQGYIVGNVQFVLKEINMMKWTLAEQDFFILIEQIYSHRLNKMIL